MNPKGIGIHSTIARVFLASGFGGTLSHITQDIVLTVKALREGGFAPLVMSPKDFDNLAARFDHNPAIPNLLGARKSSKKLKKMEN